MIQPKHIYASAALLFAGTILTVTLLGWRIYGVDILLTFAESGLSLCF